MPNWCHNHIVIRHINPEMVQRARDSLKEGRLFQEFFPCPAELHLHDAPMQDGILAKVFLEKYGAKDWYDWQVKNWGVKWDVSCEDGYLKEINDHCISAGFDSPWSPPIRGYERLIGLGFEIEAQYDEPGMGFCGTWEADQERGIYRDDEYSYSNLDPEDITAVIGKELDELFRISEYFEETREDGVHYV